MAESGPSKQEVNELARSAVALITGREEARPKTGFDPYGGLETTVAIYDIDDRFVRVGTLQDWEGNASDPDFHIVITEDFRDEEKKPTSAKETRYAFFNDSLFKSSYGRPSIDEAVVTLDENGQVSRRLHTAGNTALRTLRYTKIKHGQRKIMSKLIDLKFNRDRFVKLQGLIARCSPENRIEIEDES